MPKIKTNHMVFISIIGFLLISAFGFVRALNHFDISINCDAAYHNLAAINAKTGGEFIGGVGYSSQPILESLLRRILFVPLFGDNERTVRIPDMFSWLLITLFIPWLTFKALREENRVHSNLALSMTFLVSLWVANNELLAQHAVFGRHYEWCILISFLWFAAYRQKDFFKSKWFHLLSFLFLNSHFFSWPLVGSAYLFEIITLIKAKKQNRELFYCFTLATILFLVSTLFNWEGIYTLAFGDSWTGVPKSSGSDKEFWGTIRAGISLIRMFRSVFEIKYIFILLGFLGLWRLNFNKKLLFTLGVFLISLISIKGSSGLPFAPRYLLPFFGVSWILVIEAIMVLIRASSWFDNPLKTTFGIPGTNLLTLIGGLIFLVWLHLSSPFQEFKIAFQKGIPKKNFTPEFFEYNKIKTMNSPSIIIGGGGWPYTITLWYLRDQNIETAKVKSLSQDWLDTKSYKETIQDIQKRDPNVSVLTANGGWPYYRPIGPLMRALEKIKPANQHEPTSRTWEESWLNFKMKYPTGKTFVHFYNPMQCDSADPNNFKEIKRFGEGCIGEVVSIHSVENLEKFFQVSQSWRLQNIQGG